MREEILADPEAYRKQQTIQGARPGMLQGWSSPPFDPDCCRCEFVSFGEAQETTAVNIFLRRNPQVDKRFNMRNPEGVGA